MTDTLCFFTTFVCHYDQLPLVAKRYQERLAQIAALPGHAIVLAAEELCDLGRESLIFDLLVKDNSRRTLDRGRSRILFHFYAHHYH